MSNQTADLHLIGKGGKDRMKRRMVFMRDEKQVFILESNSADNLYKLRGLWIEGATMGQIADAAREMGIAV